jgi:hypothetical protein
MLPAPCSCSQARHSADMAVVFPAAARPYENVHGAAGDGDRGQGPA